MSAEQCQYDANGAEDVRGIATAVVYRQLELFNRRLQDEFVFITLCYVPPSELQVHLAGHITYRASV